MTLSVDGSNTSSNSNSVSITTTKTNNIILIFIAGESNNPVSSVSDAAGLTWNHAAGPVSSNNGTTVTVGDAYWAFSSGILTNNSISITRSGGDGRLMVMAINGANTTTPLDTGGTNPDTNSTVNATSSCTISSTTNNPNTMLIAWAREFQGQGRTLSSGPSGFSSVLSGGSFTWMYNKILSALQSSVSETFTWNGNLNSVMILVAIQAAKTPQPYFNRMIGGL